MLLFYEQIWMEPKLYKKRIKIFKKLLKQHKKLSCYVIIRSEIGNDLFDIVHSDQLKEGYYQNRNVRIYGVTSDMNSAYQLAGVLVEYFYQKFDTIDFSKDLKMEQSCFHKKWHKSSFIEADLLKVVTQ